MDRLFSVHSPAGRGIYVFFAGMAKIGWNFSAALGTGDYSHLIVPTHPEVPWTR